MDPDVLATRGIPTAGDHEADGTGSGSAQAPGKVRVMIADGDPVARRFLRDVLQASPQVVVVAEARDGVEAVELAVYYRPDILLSELRLPLVGGEEAMRSVHERAPEVRVVFLTTERRSAVQIELMRAGASGVLAKDTPIDGIVRAMLGIARGEAAASRALSARLLEQLREIPEVGCGERPIRSTLTPREWEVLDALCAGATPDSVARMLRVAPATVKSHLKRVMSKLGAHSREEAIVLARERFRLRESVM